MSWLNLGLLLANAGATGSGWCRAAPLAKEVGRRTEALIGQRVQIDPAQMVDAAHLQLDVPHNG